nr:L-histidine N(alpha)-methyltransferase [Granulicella cerasi]
MIEAPEALEAPTTSSAVCEAVQAGLNATPKTLPAWLFYDEHGSQLFERITELPEYYLTRTERHLFVEMAPTLAEHVGTPLTVMELGAGTASKTGVLLTALAQHQTPLLYQPIDVSASATEEAANVLTRLVPQLQVQPQIANYITERYDVERPANARVLALYIGSSIGNFSPAEQQNILRNLRSHLEPRDTLLLGLDLAPGDAKSHDALQKAYDDDAGVTAAFNKNVLTRLNREIDADFKLDQFAHRACWNASESRIEMHLESLVSQTVNVCGDAITLSKGETIHTENSYKFTDAAINTLLQDSGFSMNRTLTDENGWYAVVMADAV